MRAKSLSFVSILATSVTLSPPPVRAQTGQGYPAPDEAGAAAATALAQVVVTAHRTPTTAAQVGQSFTVLTQDAIVRDQETNVADLLDRTPGVTVARNGGPGQTTSLFIRGAEAAQTLVLIDGVKVNDPTSPEGAFDFANLITGDIARIEVLRGPQSTLYGSQAIGGVVNIITAAATAPLQGSLRGEAGDYGTSDFEAALGGRAERYSWRLSGYDDATKGVACFDEALGGRRPCAYRSRGLSGRFTGDLTAALQFDERVYYARGRADLDGYDTPTYAFGDDNEYAKTQQVVDYTGFNLSLLDGRLKNRLAYEYSRIDRTSFDPDQRTNYQLATDVSFTSAGRGETLEYEGVFALASNTQVVFGAQSERASFLAASPYGAARAHQRIDSGYGQMTREVFSGLTVTGGVRYDDQTLVGGHATGQASAAWNLNGGDTILRASFGQGFKAPSLYQLYSEYGNLALHPETANGWDAGVEQRLLDGRVVVQATYFGRDTRNLIDYVSCYGVTGGACATPRYGYYDNVARAQARGVELEATWRPTSVFEIKTNYTFDEVEDRSPGSATYGRQLGRRPENTANVSADYVWPIKLRTDLAIRYAGESFDSNTSSRVLKSYSLIDLRASYPVRQGVELYGRVENLANQHYETAYAYGTLGRAGYAGVRLSF